MLEALPFIPEKYLTDDVSVKEFVRLVFEDGDLDEILEHLRIVSRSPYFLELAADPGSTLPELAEKLNAQDNPEFATIMKVLDALGIKLTAKVTSAAGQNAA